MISAEGDVMPCCAIVGSDKATLMGNLLQEDFAQVWDGERFEKFRRARAEGKNRLCQTGVWSSASSSPAYLQSAHDEFHWSIRIRRLFDE